MDYITLPLPLRPMTDPETVPVVSLYEALQKLPDPRRAQGKRYELALIVCLVVLAKLAGQKSAPWSHRMDSASQFGSGAAFWGTPGEDALPDDLLQCLVED